MPPATLGRGEKKLGGGRWESGITAGRESYTIEIRRLIIKTLSEILQKKEHQ